MTAPTDQFIDIAKRSQEAVTKAVRTWADTVQSCTGTFGSAQSKLPDAHAVVDTTFDFVAKVLENQRQLAHTLFRTGAQAIEVLSDQAAQTAQSVTTHTVNAADAVAEKVAEASNEASTRASSNIRAARSSAANSAAKN